MNFRAEVGKARDRQGRYLPDTVGPTARRAGGEQEIGAAAGAGVAGLGDEPQQHGGVIRGPAR